MINGTFEIKYYLSKTCIETNYITLKEEADGVVKGFFGEAFFKESVSFEGKAEPDGSFTVTTGPFATIMRDMLVSVEATVSGDDMKGYVLLGPAKMPMTGKKIAEAMTDVELIKFRKSLKG